MLPVITGAGCMMAMVSAVNAISDYARPMPHLGDILSFGGSGTAPAAQNVRLIVHRQNQIGCVLDLYVLQQSGGSLVVESQPAEVVESFRVHWAGERTTADAANCGNKADLTIDVADLEILVRSAGGYDPSEVAGRL